MLLNPPPAKDTVKDVLSFSPFSGSESVKHKHVGRSFTTEHEGRKHTERKHTGKKGGILPSSEIFGCEREKTDLRNGSREPYYDKRENCLHGNVSTITYCYNINGCQGFHFIDNGLGGSRYRLACPGLSTTRSG